MSTLAEAAALWAGNAPWELWRLLGLGEPPSQDGAGWGWAAAGRRARACLAGLPAADCAGGPAEVAAAILGEGQFGAHHCQLSRAVRTYYALRPCLPARARALVQWLAARRAKHGLALAWPIEDRYVRYVFATARHLLEEAGHDAQPYLHFWPQGRCYALVLTHDVETGEGQRFIGKVAALEEQYGLRSSFNFVPEGYAVDRGLLAELRERGFEVGVHGLRHDGRLFSSYAEFQARAQRINGYVKAWQAAGFRAPMTHRNPAWMQALAVEYDASCFDTDPYEPMPGGTMSIWPFMMGHLVELPYTLAQDHTLLRTLGETTPRLWQEKVAFIRRYCGMALINSHPDYLRHPGYLGAYEALLAQLRAQGGYWHALPVQVARWWRARATAAVANDGRRWWAPELPQATIGRVSLARAAGTGAAVEGLVLEPRFYTMRDAGDEEAAHAAAV